MYLCTLWPLAGAGCLGVTLFRAVPDLAIFVGWNEGRSYCSGEGKQEQQICPVPGWEGKFSPPSFSYAGQKESFDFFSPVCSEIELEEIRSIPAKPLEAKI